MLFGVCGFGGQGLQSLFEKETHLRMIQVLVVEGARDFFKPFARVEDHCADDLVSL